MRQLFLLDNICSMHTSTVNKSSFIKDLACGPSLGLQNLMWPAGLKSLPTSALEELSIENAPYPINQQHSLLRNPITQNNTVNNVTS